MGEPNPPHEAARPLLPTRIIPQEDLPIYDQVAVAASKNGLELRLSQDPEQSGPHEQPLDPAKQVKIVLSGKSADSPPQEIDQLLFEEALEKVLKERDAYAKYPEELAKPALESAIHTATAGMGIKKEAIRRTAELPGELRKIKEKLDRDTADILGRAAQRMPEIKRG